MTIELGPQERPAYQRGLKQNPKGRPSKLDDPDTVKLVAQAFVDGSTRQEMSETFGVSIWTISTWRKDQRVRTWATRLIEERVLRVTRKVDSVIEQRLQHCQDMDTELLLKIRKEFLGGAFRIQAEGGDADAQTTNEILDALENDPDFVGHLDGLLHSLQAND